MNWLNLVVFAAGGVVGVCDYEGKGSKPKVERNEFWGPGTENLQIIRVGGSNLVLWVCGPVQVGFTKTVDRVLQSQCHERTEPKPQNLDSPERRNPKP